MSASGEVGPGQDDLDVLWQPLALRGATVPNRVMCSATTLQYGAGGLLTDRHLAFYLERARGGVGLLFTEQLTATPLSETAFPRSIRAYDERQVEALAVLAATLEPYPTQMFAQLVAGGAKGTSTGGLDGWGAVRAPSRVPAPGGEVPLPLSSAELEQITLDFARSARHVRLGGLDGLEVHGAHGWLVGQFLSPFFNRRDDAYGGDSEGRCRLALEIGRAIRAEVGEDFPVGLTLTYDEVIGDAGITIEDTEAQLEVLAGLGVYDFFDLSIGAPHAGHLTISSMAVEEGYALAASRRAKTVVGDRGAVFVAGRVVDLAMAARAVRDGDADVVAMTRAHLADPHHVRKARAGRRREITRCVGANVCVGRALRGVEVACVLNPATGREQSLGDGTLQQSVPPRHVVVVGAGPAGLRTASTAAARGHHVVVHERHAEPGGHLRELASLPTRGLWSRAVEDLVSALELHGGQLRLGSAPDADRLAADRPDVVVVATGATWETGGATARMPGREGIPGARSGCVLGLDVAIARAHTDPASLGRRVVIADEIGAYPPLGLAESLALAGAEVHVVTSAGAIGEAMLTELELPHLLPRLHRLGVTLTTSYGIDSIDGPRVVLRDVWGGTTRAIGDVDVVVLALQRSPRDGLYLELRDRLPDVHLVGDALAPRTTLAVIHEGEALGRAL